MKNTKIISIIITLGALIDTLYTVVTENQSLLSDLGVSPKFVKIIMLVGLIYTALSKSLIDKPIRLISNKKGKGAITPETGP
jgi:hypothetical protein